MDEPMAFQRPNSHAHMTTSGVLTRTGLELRIGSNIFRNTNGVVKILGKEQLVIEASPEHRSFFTTLDLYNELGIHIAHLRRNTFVLNEQERFAVETQLGQHLSPADVPSLRVTDLQSNEVIFEVQLASETKVSVTRGKLHSHKGTLIEVTSHYCRISPGTTRFGEIVEARGGPITLG